MYRFILETGVIYFFITNILLLVNCISICKSTCPDEYTQHAQHNLESSYRSLQSIQKNQICEEIYSNMQGFISLRKFECIWSKVKEKCADSCMTYSVSYFSSSNLNRKTVASLNIPILIDNCIEILLYYILCYSNISI